MSLRSFVIYVPSKIITAVTVLINNPTVFFRILYGRIYRLIQSLLPVSAYPVRKRINGVVFEFDCTRSDVIRGMFLGLYEIPERILMKKILRHGDTFIDAGANIGYLSAIAAGLVGKSGEVHSFEPVPEYFQRLQKFASLNPNYKIITNQYALGETDGVDRITIASSQNIGWNTMVPGFLEPKEQKQTIEITVRRLDKYIRESLKILL